MLPLVALLLMTAGLDVQFFADRPGIVSFSVAEVLAGLVVAVLGIRLAMLSPGERRLALRPIRRANPFVAAYALWVVAASVGAYATAGSTETLHSLKNVAPALVLCLAIVAVCRTERQLGVLHVAFLAMLLGVSSIAISQSLLGIPYVNALDPNAFQKLRLGGGYVARPVVGMLGHPNALGTLLAPVLVVTLGFLLYGGRRALRGPTRWIAWLVLAAAAVALVLTAAKSALLWTAIGGTVVIGGAVLGIRATPGRAVLALALALTAALAGIILLLAARLPLPGGIEAGTIADRFILDFEAFGILAEDRTALLFGGVARQFGSLSVLQLGVHNELLAQALRFGAVGGFLFAGVLVRACGARPGEAGWTYAAALIVSCGIYLLEAASGAQLQLAAFGLVGLGAANERIAVERENAERA